MYNNTFQPIEHTGHDKYVVTYVCDRLLLVRIFTHIPVTDQRSCVFLNKYVCN